MLAESWQIALLVLGTTICVILSRVTWSFRSENEPAARYFSVYMTCVALRSFLYLLALTSLDETSALTWMRLRYLVMAVTAVPWLGFVLALVRVETRFTRRFLLLLLVVPLVATVLAWTNDQHNLIWAQTLPENTLLAVLNSQPVQVQPLGSLFGALNNLLYLASVLVLAEAARQSGGMQRARLITVIISILPLLAANALTNATGMAFNWNTIAFPINGLILGYGILRLHLLGIVPLARSIYMQNALDAVIVTDQHGRIIDVNPTACQIMNDTAARLIGQRISKAFSQLPPHLVDVKKLNRQTQAEVTELELELAAPARAGSHLAASSAAATGKHYFEVQTYPLYGRGGRAQANVIKLRDITEQRHIELQLRQQNEHLRRMNEELTVARRLAEEADKAKGQFLATISHELRTPLHIMLGFTELLQQDSDKDSEAELARRRDFLDRVLTSGKHLLTMINGLLDLTNLQRDDFRLDSRSFDIKAWLDALAEEGKALAAAKGLSFAYRLDPNLPATITGDQGRLTEIVSYLISNAVKFTAQGSVTLDARHLMAGRWMIQVIDTGIGIPPEEQDAIFQTFRQVDGSMARRYGGMGIGLALARRLALLMGGQISVQSEVNVGSTFSLILPLITVAHVQEMAEPLPLDGLNSMAVAMNADNEVTRR